MALKLKDMSNEPHKRPVEVSMDLSLRPPETVEYTYVETRILKEKDNRITYLGNRHSAQMGTIFEQNGTIKDLQEQIRLKDEALVKQLRTIVELNDWIRSH